MSSHQPLLAALLIRTARGIVAGGIETQIERWPLGGNRDTYAPWWWLFTTTVLRQMIETCGFRIEEEAPAWGGKAHTFLSRCV